LWVPGPGAPQLRRSSRVSVSSKEFESPWVPQSITNGAAFLAGVRFEKRNVLDELPLDLNM